MKSRAFVLVVAAAAAAAARAAGADADAAKELAEKRAALAAKTEGAAKPDLARDHYALGLWARQRGLEEEARAEFAAALALDPDHAAAHEALGEVRAGDEWISFAAAMERKGLVLRGGKWILREEAEVLDLPAEERARRKEEQAKVAKLLSTYGSGPERARKYALEALAAVEDRYKVEPMAYALRSRIDAVRALAAKELGRLGNRRALGPLVWRAVHDPSADVRAAAVDAAKAIGDANLIAPWVKALGSESPDIRMNAAAAIAGAGDPRGVRYLVWRFEAHGGGSPRVYYMSATQLTFIQDFDVEVAQTAFIADPIVNTIQEGLVLDVQVVATSQQTTFVEREVIHGALRRLTGAKDVPNKPGAWAKWYEEHGSELAAAGK